MFTPLINYSSYQHVLNALPCFVHQNGNVYGIAIEKQSGIRQNLSVYRARPGSLSRELVHRYVGGVDSQAQIAAGGCVILQDGSLWVWASAVPVGIPPITTTGFVGGFWEPIPDVDEPWGEGAITLFDAPLISPAWEGRALNGGELVNIPAVFGATVAGTYLVRFVVQADAANVRVRAGTLAAPFFLTVNTQVAGVQIHAQGWVPGPDVWISTVNGVAQVWLQVLGVA